MLDHPQESFILLYTTHTYKLPRFYRYFYFFLKKLDFFVLPGHSGACIIVSKTRIKMTENSILPKF